MKGRFMDKIVSFIDTKLTPPLTKFANFRPMRVIRRGMVSVLPVIFVSSIFLILFMLGSPSGTAEKPLIGFLAPYTNLLIVVHNYCLSFLSVYAAVAFGLEFARVYELDKMNLTLLSLACFFAINLKDFTDGTISVANFGGAGLMGCILSSFIAGFVYYFCVRKKITIRLPNTVPPEILSSFTAIVPFLIAVPLCWVIRTVLNIDITILLVNVLGPIFSYADTPLGYTVWCLLCSIFWAVGIHGDNILSGITGPLTTMWVAENATAALSGVALTQLPHVWAASFCLFHYWVAGVWPLAIYLIISKVKAYKALGKTVLVPTFFICEPIMFGTPIVLNPILAIPFVLATTLSGLVSYLIMNAGFINRIFVNLPWTTPQPLQVIMSTGGDFKALIIPLVSFILGMIIYYPFIKSYEKQGLREEQEMEKIVAQE